MASVPDELAETFASAPTRRIERRRRPTRESLDQLRERHARGELSLDLQETLGVGGEGVVRGATQLALSREVAVKKLRADRQSDEAEERLLVEAWIAGLLEHPNIVPIYDIRIDEAGDLVIVYKKIEGQAWARTIGDSLELDLKVLIRVCDAVAYAHDRGIVHRDLKPGNILLGDFGEVYLTDWGIAAAIDDRHGPHIPRLADDRDIIGTPAYMAPEMLRPETGEIGPATDVYQLGAMLFECLTGRAPHAGSTLGETLDSIEAGVVELGDHLPPRLRAICRRAMAADPAARQPSASELKRELEAWLRQRGMLGVLERAADRLSELRRRIADAGDDPETRVDIYRLVAECRFGFSEAAAELPEVAARGLRDTALALVDYELERDAPEAAQAALAEIDEPPGEVRERVDAALRDKRAADAEIRAYAELGRRHDPTSGEGARKVFAVIMGLSVLFPTVARLIAWYGFGHRLAPSWGVISAIISLAPLLLFYIVFRRDIRESAVTRAAAIAVGVGIVLALILSAMTIALSWDPGTARVIFMFTVAGMSATFALYYLRALVPASIVYVACGVLVALDPENIDHRDWLTMLANGTLVASALWAWWPTAPSARRSRS